MRRKTTKSAAVILSAAMAMSMLFGGSFAVQAEETTENAEEAAEASSEAGEASGETGSVTITNTLDGEDFDVTYDSPQRIVSTSGFTTELLLALGLEDRIVGYSYMDNEIYPDFQEAFDKLTKLSDTFPSQEVLLAAEPDFLTGWASTFSDKNCSLDFCEQNGISPYVPKIEGENAGLEAAYEDLTNLGEIFGVQEKAEEVIDGMKTQIAAVEEAVAGEEAVRVFIYDSGEDEPFTLGSGLASDMIAKAGGENVFEGDFNYWGGVSWESVIEANPQYIIVMDYLVSDPIEDKLEFLNSNEALQDVDAVKNGNIFVLGLTDVTGGIRNSEAIETMAEHFHPDCFEE